MDTKLKNRHRFWVIILVLWFVSVEWFLFFGGYHLYASWRLTVQIMWFCIGATAVLAWILPLFKSLQTGDEKIFHAPAEVVISAYWLIAGYQISGDGVYQLYVNRISMGSLIMWLITLMATYWASACLRGIYTMGIRDYLKERSLIVRYGKDFPKMCKAATGKVKGWFDSFYHSVEQIDFREQNNKIILKIVLANFLILMVLCVFWFFGIFGLVVYSVVLFLLLRKYFNDIREKYSRLLDVTNQMAEGNLEVGIQEDFGIFNPLKEELAKIQSGYQKAVEKEVKSQQMKTELITNVSHDLKTPLTAIITYVNLLKEEKEEEKQKEYIDVLERKSLRLKDLIEDLFEISKASSRNVTLNLVDVDVVHLFKQVKLEHEEKFAAAELEFRCTYPQEKLLCSLDSQKTYRIFENLLINVCKYAMAKTRVYVQIEKEEQDAVIRMMNVSASELKTNAEDLLERFVRGDESRNTEGSGLGLAIAKSFTELQKGSFRIELEGDLFKAEVRFPLL